MGEILLDFSGLLSASDAGPLPLAIYLLKSGAWIPIGFVLLWGLKWAYMNYIQGKHAATKHYVLLAISIPEQTEQSPKAVENIFAQLRGAQADPNLIEKYVEGQTQESFSFEIVSTNGYVQYYIRTNVTFRDFIESLFYAQYPDAEITEVPDYTQSFPSKFPNDEYKMWGTEFRLINKNYLPIKTYESFEHSLSQELKDPIAAMLEILGKMKKGEHAWIQYIVTPIKEEWKDEGVKAITKMMGKEVKTSPNVAEMLANGIFSGLNFVVDMISGGSEFAKDKSLDLGSLRLSPAEIEVIKGIQQKISKIGFKVKIRMVYLARPEIFSKPKGVAGVVGSFQQFNNLQMNGFKPDPGTITKALYFFSDWRVNERCRKLMSAYKGRSNWRGAGTGFILNIEELASIYHFPSIEIKAPKLKRLPAKRAGAPIMLPTEEMEEIPYLVEEETIPEMKEDKYENAIPERKETISEVEQYEKFSTTPKIPIKNEKSKKYTPKTLEAPPNLPI